MGMPLDSGSGLRTNDAQPLAVEHIEITQTIQDVDHSVTLISNKRTVARVCLGTDNESSITRVRADLKLTRGTQTTTVSSLNEVVVDPADNGQITDKRNNIGATLNFLIPEAFLAAGAMTAQVDAVQDTLSGASLGISNQTRRVVNFVDSAPLRLVLIGIRYHAGNPSASYTPRTIDVRLLESWLRRVYPISELDFSYRIVDSNFVWPFTATQINTQLAAIRNQDISNGTDARTHYYGMVDENGGTYFMRGRASGIPQTPDPSTVASGPTGARDLGWDNDGSYGDWYAGHELAHTFGRFHPGFCAGNSRDDLNYPHADGQISDDGSTFVGFDVGDFSNGIDRNALPGQLWHDVMTYCSNQWISEYTYEAIHQRILAEERLDDGIEDNEGGMNMTGELPDIPEDSPQKPYHSTPLKKEEGRFVNIVAMINLTARSAKINFVNPTRMAMRPIRDPNSNVQVRLLDAEDGILKTVPVDVKLDSCLDEAEGRQGIVDVSLNVPPETVGFQILIDDRVADQFGGKTAAEPVENIRRGLAHADRSLALEWDSSQAEDPTITYSVMASEDNGETWATISIGKPTPEYSVNEKDFKDFASVKFKVIATNGFAAQEVIEDAP